MSADAATRALPRYAELPPSPALARWVACYWTLMAADAAPFTNRVLPDGCSDVIVDLSGTPEPFVVGTMRRALVLPVAGRLDLFGVRFRSGAALPFLDTPLAELTDRRVPLDALWGGPAAILSAALGDVPVDDVQGRLARAEALLLARLRMARVAASLGDDDLVARAVALVRRARGGVGVREAALALGVGERRLERAFDRCVGVPPKFLGRVVRFRAAVREIERRSRAGQPVSGSAVAHDAGYADQPHFIREFRALAGVTPAAYLAERWRVGFVQAGGGDRA
jgi:AraC-like DNA-binding protein